MYDLAILNARLADAGGCWDVVIDDGIIVSVEPTGHAPVVNEEIQAEGRYLLPGLIDAHVHTRDPGYTHKENTSSAAVAAANGGITTIMAMPNTNPPMTTAAAVQNTKACATNPCPADVYFVGGACAAAPSWILPTVRAGVIALDVYDDLFAYGTKTWIRVFEEAKKANVPLCCYLMDSALEQSRKNAARDAGASELEQIVGATDGETEAMSIAKIFPMAAYFDVPVVLRMVSTARGIETVRHMRSLYPNARVYVEVCVHYLFLTWDSLLKQGSKAHIHPPLRTQKDIEGLWNGIADGTIDYIASDHAPHASYEKKSSLSASASGMVGLETMLPLLLDACTKGKLSLRDIQRLCCEKPAEIYGLSDCKGRIQAGAKADLVLVDTEARWMVRHDEFYTHGTAGPFDGLCLTGKPILTICAGKRVMERGKIFWKKEE